MATDEWTQRKIIQKSDKSEKITSINNHFFYKSQCAQN